MFYRSCAFRALTSIFDRFDSCDIHAQTKRRTLKLGFQWLAKMLLFIRISSLSRELSAKQRQPQKLANKICYSNCFKSILIIIIHRSFGIDFWMHFFLFVCCFCHLLFVSLPLSDRRQYAFSIDWFQMQHQVTHKIYFD